MFARAFLRRPPRRLPLLRILPRLPSHLRLFTASTRRLNGTPEHPPPSPTATPPADEFSPPPYCPGCGAPSQQSDARLPGYYARKPSKRQRFGADNLKVKTHRKHHEDSIFAQALSRLRSEQDVAGTTANNPDLLDLALLAAPAPPPPPPVCARCHSMTHHHTAPPLPAYPTLDTLTNLLAASPHKTNHIYHLLDAADLPLTLLPDLRNHVYTTLPRDVTRGLTISYVVTRSDLLMPTEKQVASLMTWVKKVVKDALPAGEKVEGREPEEKIHVVSARQGWGIGKLKEEVRRRTGGVWVVGRVNVGKSRLVREVWPETGIGRAGEMETAEELGLVPEEEEEEENVEEGQEPSEHAPERSTEPAKPPPMHQRPPQVPPTVSDIPGTTAAPIKVRFKTSHTGGKKTFGELVDLPGLARWVGFGDNGLLPHVREDKHREFGMEKRVKPEQYTIKPGQSMIIAGVILVTPKLSPEDDTVILAYPFTSLPVHVTSTRKALQQLSLPDPASQPGISLFQKPPPEAPPPSSSPPTQEPTPYTPLGTSIHPRPSTLPPHFSSAGVYPLSTDVTALRHTTLPSKHPSALSALPFRILATDLVLSGLGWVELVSQVRRRKEEAGLHVAVEVFTPDGGGVGERMTMGADMLRMRGAMLAGATGKVVRQRRSMKGVKKRGKVERKRAEGGAGAA